MVESLDCLLVSRSKAALEASENEIRWLKMCRTWTLELDEEATCLVEGHTALYWFDVFVYWFDDSVSGQV